MTCPKSQPLNPLKWGKTSVLYLMAACDLLLRMSIQGCSWFYHKRKRRDRSCATNWKAVYQSLPVDSLLITSRDLICLNNICKQKSFIPASSKSIKWHYDNPCKQNTYSRHIHRYAYFHSVQNTELAELQLIPPTPSPPPNIKIYLTHNYIDFSQHYQCLLPEGGEWHGQKAEQSACAQKFPTTLIMWDPQPTYTPMPHIMCGWLW